MILQCDKEMSIIDVCRKVARGRNARTVLRFAPKTSHQSNGFCLSTGYGSEDVIRLTNTDYIDCSIFVQKKKTGLSKQCTDTHRDLHDATRHKLRRTLAYNFQQFHLPFHLQFVTLDLFSQDSQCDPTAQLHSNVCLVLHMCHLVQRLVNRYML